MEIVLSTIDEVDDYLEPAYVYTESGVTVGLDFMSEDGEITWIGSEPLPDPHGVHDYVLLVDAASGSVEVSIDGAPWLSERIPRDFWGRRQLPPFKIVGPPDKHAVIVGRSTVSIESMEVRDPTTGETALRFDVVDPADWTPESSAAIRPPYSTPRIIKGDSSGHVVRSAELFDLTASQSATWLYRGDVFPAAPGHSATWLGSSRDGLIDGSGWALTSAPSQGLAYGMTLSDGVRAVTVDAGEFPEGDHTTVVVLDRKLNELRLYLDGIRVDVADASGLGEITTRDSSAYLFPGVGSGALDCTAVWRRALDDDEVATIP